MLGYKTVEHNYEGSLSWKAAATRTKFCLQKRWSFSKERIRREVTLCKETWQVNYSKNNVIFVAVGREFDGQRETKTSFYTCQHDPGRVDRCCSNSSPGDAEKEAEKFNELTFRDTIRCSL